MDESKEYKTVFHTKLQHEVPRFSESDEKNYDKLMKGYRHEMEGQEILDKLKIPYRSNPKDWGFWLSNVGFGHDIRVVDTKYEFKALFVKLQYSWYLRSWKARDCDAYVVNNIDLVPHKVLKDIRRSGRELISIKEFGMYARHAYNRYIRFGHSALKSE
jgi:hypothetical protein